MESSKEEKSSSSSFEDLSNLKEEEFSGDSTIKQENEVTDILGNGQLTKKVLVEGASDSRPERSDVCKVNVEGRVQETGLVVEKLENKTVQLGDYEVVQGLDMAIPLMDVGETAEIVCNSRFAYGSIGLVNNTDESQSIPPDATLVYTVKLLSAKPADDIEELEFQLRKKIGNRKRERGNFWFERNEYNMSIQCYRRALEYLDDNTGESIRTDEGGKSLSESEIQELLEDRIKTYNNLAMAQMKISAWNAALKSVENVLLCQPENVKALYRKGKILDALGDVSQAIVLLQKAATLDVENRAIQNELSKLILKSKREAQNEKNLYQKMLGQAQKIEQKSTEVKTDQIENNKFKLWGYLIGTILAGVAGMALYRYKYF